MTGLRNLLFAEIVCSRRVDVIGSDTNLYSIKDC